MNAVGYKYQYGTGVKKDLALAVHWYCKAVEAGNPRGINNLAIMLNEGAQSAQERGAGSGSLATIGGAGARQRHGQSRLLIAAKRGRQAGSRSRGWLGWSALQREANRTPKCTCIQLVTPGRCRRRLIRGRRCCLLREALRGTLRSARIWLAEVTEAPQVSSFYKEELGAPYRAINQSTCASICRSAFLR